MWLLGIFWTYLGIVVRSFGHRAGIILNLFGDHSEIIVRSFENQPMICFWSLMLGVESYAEVEPFTLLPRT